MKLRARPAAAQNIEFNSATLPCYKQGTEPLLDRGFPTLIEVPPFYICGNSPVPCHMHKSLYPSILGIPPIVQHFESIRISYVLTYWLS